MRKLRRSLACLGTLTILVTACGRSDDSGTDTTTAATTAPSAETTAAPAETTAPETTDTTAAGSGDTTAAPGTTAAGTTAPAAGGTEGYALTAADIEEQCASEPLEATEIGVTDKAITIQVMADTGSPLAPGLFQANIDAVTAFADWINANGGVGCRQLKVETWDSKLDATEGKNGLINACSTALAMVGGNTLFNPDVTPMTSCPDQAGAVSGIPNMAALANDVNELCAPTTFTIQYQAEECPIPSSGIRHFTFINGHAQKLVELHPENTKGIALIPGDLPTTRQSAMPNIEAQAQAGITFDAKVFVSGRDEQSAYTARVQYLKNGDNYVYNGSDDVAMTRMMKESIAQGVDMDSVVFNCSLACYSQDLVEQGGDAVNGAYVWMQFLPFEEADTNEAATAYLDAVGADKADAFGAQAWQAAIAFQQAVNQIVADQGPNAVTRANLTAAFAAIQDFTADGWAGARSLDGISACFVLLQVQDSAFTRVWPEERGTLDCESSNLVEFDMDPVAEAAALG